MKPFTVAILQILPGASTEENREKGFRYCRMAKEAGADLALFPEMWSCGYQIPEDIRALHALAVRRDGEFVRSFGLLAKELHMAVGITFLEEWEPLPKNSLCVFDRFGERVLSYSKVHTCDFGDESRLTRGDGFYTAELKTETDTVRLGAMICYDREFPESARILMLKGAEIILVPNSCPMELNRISQLRARAYENMTGIATCNYPAGKEGCNGHSTAFDGMAYLPENSVSRDTLIVDAGEAEGIYLAHFPMDKIREYRASEVHGNAYRRPELYGALTETGIAEPFIRPDRKN